MVLNFDYFNLKCSLKVDIFIHMYIFPLVDTYIQWLYSNLEDFVI